MKTITDVPPEKLKQLFDDLRFEGVVQDAIRVSPQSDGKLRIEFSLPDRAPATQSTTSVPPASGTTSAY